MKEFESESNLYGNDYAYAMLREEYFTKNDKAEQMKMAHGYTLASYNICD